MRSLERLQGLDLTVLYPGHGPEVDDPQAKIAEYIAHRQEREDRLVAALERGERSRAALLAEVWDDVPTELRGAGGDRDAGAPGEARGRGAPPRGPARLTAGNRAPGMNLAWVWI